MLTRQCLGQPVGRRPAPFTPVVIGRRNVVSRVGQNPMSNPQMQEMMKKAMSDPNFQKQMQQMQEMMKRPEMQQQMAQMQAVMQNQQLQQRMQTLKNDPEFAEIFAEIQKGGMQALMKYYNDPTFLSKLGEKLGDVAPGGAVAPAGPAAAAAAAAAASPLAGGAAAGAGAPPPAPEVNNIRDAAKYGDEEAVEDFIAIGKDLNEADAQGRTALHYAVAYDHAVIAKMLIDEGVNLEARDSMKNTPLHYACGYGRIELAHMLLDAGADKTAQNNTGKTPIDLAKLDGRNPVNADEELVKRLSL